MRYGAHVSISGSIDKAVDRAREITAECIQIFASPPQGWRPPQHEESDVSLFRKKCDAFDVRPVVLHTVYLVNFASANEQLCERSIQSVSSYMEWAGMLGATGVITHLGSHGGSGFDAVQDRVCEAIGRILEATPEGVSLLLETSAGMGNSIGSRFEHLGRIIQALDGDPRLGICLDTAHIFESGYEVRSAAGLANTMGELESLVGLDRLKVLHVNDSKTRFASGVDRHQNLGRGHLGRRGLRNILRQPAFRRLPLILEVPGFDGKGPDPRNLAELRALSRPLSRRSDHVPAGFMHSRPRS